MTKLCLLFWGWQAGGFSILERKNPCSWFLFHLAASLFSFRSLWHVELLEDGSDYFAIKSIQVPDNQFITGSMAAARRAPDHVTTCAKCSTSCNCDEVWNFYVKIKSIMADTVHYSMNSYCPAPTPLLIKSWFFSELRSVDSREGISFFQLRGLIMIGLGWAYDLILANET